VFIMWISLILSYGYHLCHEYLTWKVTLSRKCTDQKITTVVLSQIFIVLLTLENMIQNHPLGFEPVIEAKYNMRYYYYYYYYFWIFTLYMQDASSFLLLLSVSLSLPLPLSLSSLSLSLLLLLILLLCQH